MVQGTCSLEPYLYNKIMKPQELNTLIKNRRSIFPKAYTKEIIADEIIQQVLENANQAPNHRKTEPWRFTVMQGEGLDKFGYWMAEWYKNNTPEERFKETVYTKFNTMPSKAHTVIAICMKRDEEERVPEWEEIAAVAMAVQNMWLTCTAHNIGCFWSTPRPALNANEFLNLQEGERCLGLFYMGHHEMPEIASVRGAIEEKVNYIK